MAVARFVEAIRFDDFSQRFTLGRGTGFEALGKALDSAIVELGAKRAQAAEDARFLSAVVDDAPAALLTIDEDDRVTLLNKAARRQFVDQPGVPRRRLRGLWRRIRRRARLAAVGPAADPLIKDGVAQRVMIETARIERLGSNLRIVSMLPVQNVLGAAEMAAQSGLVRVLTHEIMNSLTPVTSLVRSAADILAAAEHDPKALAEARQAVEIAASRAEGMHRFVETYRSFARLPEIRRRRFAAGPWAAEIARLCAADPVTAKIALDVVRPGRILARRRPRPAGPGVPQPAAQRRDRGAQPFGRAADRDVACSRAETAARGSKFTTMARASIPTGGRISSCPSTPPGPTAPASASASRARSSSPTAEPLSAGASPIGGASIIAVI